MQFNLKEPKRANRTATLSRWVCVRAWNVSDGDVLDKHERVIFRVSIKVIDLSERITCLCLEKSNEKHREYDNAIAAREIQSFQFWEANC
jgi:hypothetical protein